MAERAAPRRRWLAPEVVQTSPMDCGPASLKCLLEGFRVPVSYGRLREACQTDVDGTSIDALTEAARALGLDAAQLLVPVDHVAHEAARTLPAIAVVRLPSGANHFVVAWRRSGSFVQVMDPASGRRWMRVDELRRQLYEHGTPLPAGTWRRFAGAPHALKVLAQDVARSGHREPRVLVENAARDEGWRSLAALEAAARMVRSLVDRRAIERGTEASSLLESLYERARSEDPAMHGAIPPAYWSVRPYSRGDDGDARLHVRGALLVRVGGAEPLPDERRDALSPELAAALSEPPARPLRAILREIAPSDRRRALALLALTCISAVAVLAQALVFQTLFVVGARFGLDEQRLGLVVALVSFTAGLVLLDLPLVDGFLRLGRGVEARWRAAFQRRIPLLPDRWFSSRPSSDMAERAHGLSLLRGLPALGARAARITVQLALTAAGLVWLDPEALPTVLVACAIAGALPFAFQPALHERELSLRNHHGALARFYLETLLGLVAVRVHGADRRLRREHEGLLVEWLRAGRRLARTATMSRALVSSASVSAAAFLVVQHLARHPSDPSTLLFAYWSLSLPALGEQLAQVALALPAMRNAALRALEPITAPVEASDREPVARRAAREDREREPLHEPLEALDAGAAVAPALKAAGPGPAATHGLRALPPLPPPSTARDGVAIELGGVAIELGGVAIELGGVELVLGGHAVLAGVQLVVRAGEHVALVGRSGAGKSSLIGLVLGFHRATSGRVRVDGRALDAHALADIRRSTAWVDPAAQIWNQSLFENLAYGVGSLSSAALSSAIEDANLRPVLEELPAGLASPLGEGGGFLSGGEGQRVRLARAMLRPQIRLALLDEPFRGLDRATRRTLLDRARARWRDATLVCATHDLEETLRFDRVVVLDEGRIVADGDPRDLARDEDGPYARLVRAERELADGLWSAPGWTRWHVEGGRVHVERRAEDRT